MDPDLVTHGEFTMQGSRRTTRYARVPHTAATVLFKLFDVPARVVHLVDIIDDPDDLQELLPDL